MEQRLSVITIGAENLAAMRAFYVEKLGWKPVTENKDIIFFKMNGFLFSIFEKKGLAAGAGVAEKGNGFRSFTLAYNVNSRQEVDSLFEMLKTKGVNILKAPEDTSFGGYFFYFSDVEDNVLEIAFNPYVPMDKEGNIVTHENINQL